MHIIINSIDNKYLENIFFKNLDDIYEIFKQFSSTKVPLEAKIFAINEPISSYHLSKFRNNLEKLNIHSLSIYSNNRDTILAGKSLKINSNFVKEKTIKNELNLIDSLKKDDIFHEGTVRSGERIFSNGNLCIVGDVNPGAIVSAKNNIYVWGKLLGIAFAGKGGNKRASIASLYLNPLQLRIADVVAIGPKDKPNNHYPEIALVDKQTINIKPYIMGT